MNIETIPLCVDLDGTLVGTDMLVESFLVLVKSNPLYLVLSPFWLLKGKAHLKREIARRVRIDPGSLPYAPDLLAFLTEEHRRGRPLVLATASDELIARPIADHLGLFGEVLASDGRTNLSGSKKLEALRGKFGAKGFDYVGDGKEDLKIWECARYAFLASPSRLVLKKAQDIATVKQVFGRQRENLRSIFKSLRTHQWAKNVLIFVSLITAHKLTNGLLALRSALAFLAFSLCASSGYILNDLLDLTADRKHARKRARPFASGDLPLAFGILAVPLLLIAGLSLAATLPPEFLMTTVLYFVLSCAYSFYFKKMIIADVVILAALYTLRIFAGSEAIGVPTSHWLMAFSMFMFTSLAFVKRFSEIRSLHDENKAHVAGRGYVPGDLEQLASLGAASGYVGVLVFALYVNSGEVSVLYAHPARLWLIAPFILYWISRIRILAHRGEVDEDPVIFALKDKATYLAGFSVACLMWWAL